MKPNDVRMTVLNNGPEGDKAKHEDTKAKAKKEQIKAERKAELRKQLAALED